MKMLQHCSAAVRNGLKDVDKAFDAWDILRGFQGWGDDAGGGEGHLLLSDVCCSPAPY